MSQPFFAPILGVIAALTAGTVIVSSETSAQPKSEAKAEPVLLELFTSQGCSSCPPADKVADKLDREGDAVIISRPVTYWDRLGWKDTLASEANTDLQRAYARRGLEGRNGVYTPQAVTHGTHGIVGSNEIGVRRLIAQVGQSQTSALRAKTLSNGDIAVGVAGPIASDGELSLITVKRKATIAIGRGENTGRTVTYTNVYQSEQVAGQWNGGEQGLVIGASLLSQSKGERNALVLRESNSGRVLAARWVS